MTESALWLARARATGPLLVDPEVPTPDGMRRLPEPGTEQAWLVPATPDEVTPSVVTELGLGLIGVEQPNETNRVLLCCLRCCWSDADKPWPGVAASMDDILDVAAQLAPGRSAESTRMLTVGALRRLATHRWILLDEAKSVVRLGPAVALWPDSDLGTLRDLCRDMPGPRE
ncbi:hypothetical protein [Fodinicola acaciae]|uniref:hypothetical protein n=1 Tax=Fodinicola acaciae TaxID=2681555 RepID=UPI0013D2D18C|nr:hypothetical protein [Fodinicola acaciae]